MGVNMGVICEEILFEKTKDGNDITLYLRNGCR
jgi:hypothetical protein